MRMADIELRSVSLTYPLFEGSAFSMRRRLMSMFGVGRRELGVSFVEGLKDISLEIEHGSRLGLIGRNGAGKSTFLRLLAGIYQPSQGQMLLNGSVTTLFDLSLGMDEEASGYENMYIAGALLGFSRSEMLEHVKEIEEFSELGVALSRSVKTYSAGMRVRLAFALATLKHSDIILVDEIVGVGDTAFLHKAKMRVQKMMERSSIFCLASHAEFMLTDFCERGLVFDRGMVVYDGPVQEAICFYNEEINVA